MLFLMLDGWMVCAVVLMLLLVLMFMFSIVLIVVMALFSPMMMYDTKGFKQALNYEEEEYCTDEDKGYEFAIRSRVFIRVG